MEGRIIGKTLTMPKQEDIILNSMTQTKKNGTPWPWIDFYEGATVFRISIFIFLFRTNGKKEHLDENDFRHGYGNYFDSATLKVTWYQQEH